MDDLVLVSRAELEALRDAVSWYNGADVTAAASALIDSARPVVDAGLWEAFDAGSAYAVIPSVSGAGMYQVYVMRKGP
jgi:hypothetical protein